MTAFGKWLVDKSFFNIEIHNDNKYKKTTVAGTKIGIVSEWRTYGDRDHYAVTYKREAQQFLLDNLDEIIASRIQRGKPCLSFMLWKVV